MSFDPFAAAVGEDWSSEDDGECAAAVLGRLGLPPCMAADGTDPRSGQCAAEKGSCVAQKRSRGRPSKPKVQPNKASKKPKMAAPITSELRLLEPAGDPKDNNLHVVFIKGAQSVKSDTCSKLPKRLSCCGLIPVPIWPQYEVSNLSGTWVVINPYSEKWLEEMVHHCRPSGEKITSAKIARDMKKRCRQAVMVMLRKALKTQGNSDSQALDDVNLDAAEFGKGTLSGFTFGAFPVLKVIQGM
jgi:hypothetical protein